MSQEIQMLFKHFGIWFTTSVVTKITNFPKLTNKELSYTGIGWENPVSKSFLPKTKFRLGFTR